MNTAYLTYDELDQQDRLDLYAAAADRLGTNAQAVEKDLWVCRTIDAMFKGLPRMPKLYFKGGTSLSKGFGLIKRFSEDVDIVLSRKGLGLKGERDPLTPGLSKNKRKKAAEIAKITCRNHVLGKMSDRLAELMPQCELQPDDSDPDGMSLRLIYPSDLDPDPYLKPWVKIECGARGAVEPEVSKPIVPYIQNELGTKIDLTTPKVTMLRAERTFWDKALILHGLFCGHRDEKRRLGDKNLISRHYYDLAMMVDTTEGRRAAADRDLLTRVREYKIAHWSAAWEKLGDAKPGSLHLVPKHGLRSDIANDYEAMQGMMFGQAPKFDWVLGQLARLEHAINNPLL